MKTIFSKTAEAKWTKFQNSKPTKQSVLSCVMFLEAKLCHNTTDRQPTVSQHSLCKRQPLPPYLQAAITNFTRIIISSIPTLLILQAGLHINNRGVFQQCSLILLQFTPALWDLSMHSLSTTHWRQPFLSLSSHFQTTTP